MAKRPRYLHEHPKNGGFYFRRGIPADLRQFFPERGANWRKNFGHKDEARAVVQTRELSNVVEAAFIDAAKQLERMRAAEPPPDVHSGVVVRLVSGWKLAEKHARAQVVLKGFASGRPEFDKQVRIREPFGPSNKDEEPEEWLARREVEDGYIQGWLQTLLDEAGLALLPEHPLRQILWNGIREAWGEVLLKEHRWRLMLDLEDMPTEPPPAWHTQTSPARLAPRIDKSPSDAFDGLRLTQALERWSNPPGAIGTKAPAARTVTEAKLAVRRYVELKGDVQVSEIKKRHAAEYRDAIVKIPKGLPQKINALPINEILSLDLDEYDLRSAVTINKSLNLLGAIVSSANKDGYLNDAEGWSSPFSVLLPVDMRLEKPYQPFDLSHLTAFANSPVFARGERPTGGRGETAFWAPLIGLFHGPRRSEVLQLLVGDIRQDSDTGIWVMSVEADDTDRSVKTVGSKRIFPIHPALIDAGFLTFVRRRKEAVGVFGSLWEGFEDRAKLYGRMVRWSKWFNEYLAEHVVDDRQIKFQSFRGTFKRYGRTYTSVKVLDAICGHISQSVADNYGKLNGDSGFDLSFLHQEISKIKYTGFSIPKIE